MLPIYCILFLLIITLHNLEEALWLPKWSKNAGVFHQPMTAQTFYFAVLMITITIYFFTGLFLFFPENTILMYIFFGIVTAMAGNVIFPHLIATIVLRRYAPGLISGILLMLPFNILIIIYGFTTLQLSLMPFLLSSILSAVSLIGMILLANMVSGKLLPSLD